MKYLIATDIHGSAYYANKAVQKFQKYNAEQLILLGDIYNHGPRNPFPKDYAPMQVADTLNAIAAKVVAIKGNCDSEVDQMISDFPFVSDYVLPLNNRRIYFTHGHVFNKLTPPTTATEGDVVFYGHFQVSEITENNGVICVNVGSTSLPKDGKHVYCLLTDSAITIYDLITDEVFLQYNFNA